MNLTCLTDLIPGHLDEEPRREQRAWLDGSEAIQLQTTLDNTGVIRRLPDIGVKELVEIQRIYVDAGDLVWVSKQGTLWDSLYGPIRQGTPSMRERRARGRDHAARTRKQKEVASQ